MFGPQKGVTEEMKQPLDAAMARYGQAVAKAIGSDYMQEPGAGAAGGLGFAFRSFLKAELTPGIELILNAVGLEQELTDADYAITGEGKLDFQTAMGKAPVGVAKLAKKHGVRVLAFAGSVTKEARACNAAGIDAFFPIVRGVTTLEEAMKTGSRSGEYARKRGAGVPGGCGSDWKLVVLFRKIAGKQEFHRKNNRKSNFRGTMEKFTAYKTCPAALSDSSSPAPDR